MIVHNNQFYYCILIENLLKDGLLEIFENEEGKKRLRLTRKGILLANNVFIEFV